MYAEEYSDVMEQSVEEERRQAEEAAEAARLEAEVQAAVQAEAEAAAQAEAGSSGLESGENAELLAAETGDVSMASDETLTDANSEPVVVSTEIEAEAPRRPLNPVRAMSNRTGIALPDRDSGRSKW